MPKIGIYIPDDGMDQIEAWRDRINFSQLFMEAFDQATGNLITKTKLRRSIISDIDFRLNEIKDAIKELDGIYAKIEKGD